jgi:uridylate kinase
MAKKVVESVKEALSLKEVSVVNGTGTVQGVFTTSAEAEAFAKLHGFKVVE